MLDFILNKVTAVGLCLLLQFSNKNLAQKGTFVRTYENIFETNFEPDSLTNLWFWFDANDTNTLFQDVTETTKAINNGDVISLWKDKSVNGLDVSQTVVVDKPVLALNQFHGNNVVDFDATDWFERILGTNYTGDFTLYIVLMSQDPSPPNFESFYASHNNPNTNGAFQIDYNDGPNTFQVRSRLGGAQVNTVFDTFTDNVVKLFGLTYDAGTNEIKTYVNGAQTDLTINNAVFHSRIRVNSNRNTSRNHDGQIAEIIAYKEVLSPCKNGKIITYLNEKYATSFVNKPTPGGIGCDENILWLRSDSGTSTTTDGANISQWNNLSFVTGIDATQPVVGFQPVFQDNVISNINFNPTIRFVNHHLEIPAPGIFAVGTLYNYLSCYIVLKDDDANDLDWVLYEGSAGLDRFSLSLNSGGGITGDYDMTILNSVSVITPTTTTPHLFSFHSGITGIFGISNNQNQAFNIDGTTMAFTNSFTGFTGINRTFYVGDHEELTDSPNNPFTGNIAEIIIFQDSLSTIKRQKIETYLAIKYGITSGVDYISNNGTIVYDISNGYGNGIIGVGKEVSGGFYQKKSHSETDLTDGLTIELTTDIASGVYAICGHDGGVLTRSVLAGETNVLTRKWYSNHTGGVGTINLEVDLNEIGAGLTPSPSDVKILIANNPAFNNTYKIEASSVVAGVAYFKGIPLYDKYFTFSIP